MIPPPLPPLASAGIIGLGVIGGSIARDLAALDVRVLAYDRDPATLSQARAEGVVSEALDATLAGIEATDIVIVAVPLAATRDVLRQLANLDCAAIADVGSVKSSVLDEACRLGMERAFVGSHPMAGDHRTGWAHSRRGMFAGVTTYICAPQRPGVTAIVRVTELWHSLGAEIVQLDAVAHDRLLAYSSHLPHVTAAAIALALGHAKVRHSDLGPGGRDVTRIAGSSPDMWTTIALENADALLPAVSSLQAELARFERGLRDRDERVLRELLSDARVWTQNV